MEHFSVTAEMVSGDMLAALIVKAIILLSGVREHCVETSIEQQGNFMPLNTLFV